MITFPLIKQLKSCILKITLELILKVKNGVLYIQKCDIMCRNSFAKDITVSNKVEQVMTCLQLEVIDNLQLVHFHK